MNATTTSLDSFGLGHLLGSHTSLDSVLRFDRPASRSQSGHGQETVSDTVAKASNSSTHSAVDLTIFDGFTDFALDLSCLSSPPSPSSSATELPPSTSPTASGSSCYHSPPSPPPQLPSPSIFTQALSSQPSRTFGGRSLGHKSSSSSAYKHASSSTVSHLSAVAAATTNVVRGSWPLMKYVGRGTPIDRNRRIEWGGHNSEDVVAEDGVLFTTIRATSLESTHGPSEGSIPPDWNHISPSSSPSSGHNHLHHNRHYVDQCYSSTSSAYLGHSSTNKTAATIGISSSSKGFGISHEEGMGGVLQTLASSSCSLPETAKIQIEGLGSDHSAEWESIIQTVLETSVSASTSINSPPDGSTTGEEGAHHKSDAIGATHGQDHDVNDQINATGDLGEMALDTSALDMDLGLDKALDLGLGLHGGMNWFTLGIIPSSTSASTSNAQPVSLINSDAHQDGVFNLGENSDVEEEEPEFEIESAGLAGIGAGGRALDREMKLKDKDGADTPSLYSVASYATETPPSPTSHRPDSKTTQITKPSSPPPIPARAASRRFPQSLTHSSLNPFPPIQTKSPSKSHFNMGKSQFRPHPASEMHNSLAHSAQPAITVLDASPPLCAKSDDHHSSRTGSGSSKTETNTTRIGIENKVLSLKGSSSKSERAYCDRKEDIEGELDEDEEMMGAVGVGIGKGIANVTSAGIGAGVRGRGRANGAPWWKRVFQRFKRVKVLVRTQSNYI